jgi:cytochrome c-type biogenesis protein CcmE
MVVRGEIDKATVWRSPDGLTLRFTLVGKDQTLPVEYTGLVPDTFDRATEVTVGGRVAAGGAFAADQLSVQCPAKYEAVPPGAATAASSSRG